MAAPPPPPPPDEPPPPPEPEEEEPPPELDSPPPPITLDQLDMALNPGTGGSMAGDFALPTFDVNSTDLGGLEIFELGDVDSPPQPRTKIEFSYPSSARRKGITGVVKVEYVVNENGRVEQINIVESPDSSLSKATEDVLERARFEPAQKSGLAVKVRMRAAIPYR
jgi:protein TonB